ncbi:hypothetical protein I4U23_027462 [Adineta vaga]|nr:hypothetical protein I4U23_027462 [Adineta vaga]
MKRIIESSLKEELQSSILFHVPPLTASLKLDSALAQLITLLPKIDVQEQIENDAYIIWLKQDRITVQEYINGINVKMFYANDELNDWISKIRTSNVFLIVDYILFESIKTLLLDSRNIILVYILMNETNAHSSLVANIQSTICKISSNKDELFHLIMQDIDMCTKDLISTSILDLVEKEESTNQIKNSSFLWYYLLIDSLFSLKTYTLTAKSDLIKYCRDRYSEDIIELEKISEFERDYSSTNAIRWYTRNSFLYRLLNEALRIRDIDTIFKLRFFIIDLQNQLEKNYNEELFVDQLRLYRGQLMSPLELEKLEKSIGKHISINTYFSTSVGLDVAKTFIGTEPSAVLFEIETDIAAHSGSKRTLPVSVQTLSVNPDEMEVIFPIGTIFNIESMKKEGNQWHIKLKQINHDDKLLQFIQTKYMNSHASTVRFGDLLLDMGDCEKAERYTQMLIDELIFSDDKVTIAYAYDLMGQVRSVRGDHKSALHWFENALDALPSENIYRGTIYLKICSVYLQGHDICNAHTYCSKALNYERHMDHSDLASMYILRGDIYQHMNNFDDALFYLNKSVNLCRSHMPNNHPIYVRIYLTLATIYETISDYKKALGFYKSVLCLLLQIVSEHHPDIVFAYERVAAMYINSGHYELAMVYCQKALTNIKKFQNDEDTNKYINPIVPIFLYSTVGALYAHHTDVANALDYAKKAVNEYIRYEYMIPKTYPIIESIYNSLGSAYDAVGDITSALDTYIKVLDLPVKDVSVRIMTLGNIANMYLKRSDREMALTYLYKSYDLISEIPSCLINYNHLANIMFGLSYAYKHKNDFETALSFAEKSLQLLLISPKQDSIRIAGAYSWLGLLCPDKMKMCCEEMIKLMLKDNFPALQGSIHNTTIGWYFYEQNNFSDAIIYFQKALNKIIAIIPVCYSDLMNAHQRLALTYVSMKTTDSNNALIHCEAIHDIYLQLVNMKEIPLKDKAKMRNIDGLLLPDDIKQSYSHTRSIFSNYRTIGYIYNQRDDHKQALNYFLKSEEILTEYLGKTELKGIETLYGSIECAYVMLNEFDQALHYCEKRFQQELINQRDYGKYYASIACYYYQKKEYLVSLSKYKIALTFLHNTKSKNYKLLSEAYYYVASIYMKLNNYDYASIYQKLAMNNALQCDPIDYKHLSNMYDMLGFHLSLLKPFDCDEPLYYYLKAIEHSKHPVSIYSGIQLLYLTNGQFNKADEYTKKILDINLNEINVNYIDIASTYVTMGIINYKLGRYKMARICYLTAFSNLEKSQCNNTHAYYGKFYDYTGMIYYEYGHLIEARNCCLKARDIFFSHGNEPLMAINTYIHLGLVECKMENYYDALDYFGQAIELIYNQKLLTHVAERIIYNHIGYVYYKLGQTQVAMKNYLKSLSMHNKCLNHPDLAQVYKNIGLIHEHDSQNYPLALSFYKQAAQLVIDIEHPHNILYKSIIQTLKFKMIMTTINNFIQSISRLFFLGEAVEQNIDINLINP